MGRPVRVRRSDRSEEAEVEQSAVDVVELHERALGVTRGVVAGVAADQWELWIDTAGTDVRTLVNHIVVETSWVDGLVAGEPLDSVRERIGPATDVLGDDPVAAYDRAAARADAAFRAAGSLSAPCRVPPAGTLRRGVDYCGTRFVDVLVHGWEIAKVTGQSTRLDPQLADAARVVIEPEIAALAERGVIRTPLTVPTEADSQTRFLALFGFSD
jgi:uncharacterized protein (TIGR03086 family)